MTVFDDDEAERAQERHDELMRSLRVVQQQLGYIQNTAAAIQGAVSFIAFAVFVAGVWWFWDWISAAFWFVLGLLATVYQAIKSG